MFGDAGNVTTEIIGIEAQNETTMSLIRARQDQESSTVLNIYSVVHQSGKQRLECPDLVLMMKFFNSAFFDAKKRLLPGFQKKSVLMTVNMNQA